MKFYNFLTFVGFLQKTDMSIINLLNNSSKTAFSFEILPPLKGNNFSKVCAIIDKLREFDPKYINITTHHSENIYKPNVDGSLVKINVRYENVPAQ